ncbi:hypothetical protein GGP87_003233 [Salinibacter ruber]|nr:hypothetical protein [Salinibacter ruber]
MPRSSSSLTLPLWIFLGNSPEEFFFAKIYIKIRNINNTLLWKT